jgi:hypothetical protein
MPFDPPSSPPPTIGQPYTYGGRTYEFDGFVWRIISAPQWEVNFADLVIPLSDETTALTASSTVAKVTIPYWPRATVLTDLPIWAVASAPIGAALQFDIQVGGSSIYLPASGGTYPTITAGSTNSTASAGAFTTAFAAAPTIAVGLSVSFFVRQIGSTVAGVGLKVALRTRRAE